MRTYCISYRLGIYLVLRFPLEGITYHGRLLLASVHN